MKAETGLGPKQNPLPLKTQRKAAENAEEDRSRTDPLRVGGLGFLGFRMQCQTEHIADQERDSASDRDPPGPRNVRPKP